VTPAAAACSGDLVCSGTACKTSCTADADCASGFCEAATCHLGAVSIIGGETFSCALLSDGSVRCWGDNRYGQLGNGTITTTGLGDISTPVTVTGLPKPATAIAGQGLTAYALLSDGSVWAWGYNFFGELGNGTFTETGSDGIPTPGAVIGLGGAATNIAAGLDHACAVVGGTVWCWGVDSNGQLGDGMFDGGTATPEQIAGLSSVSSIACGYYHSCAVAASFPYCWGENEVGTLGVGSFSVTNNLGFATPQGVDFTSLPTIIEIAASGSNSCALFSLGNADCWGSDNWGTVGDGSITGPGTAGGVDIPTAVSGLTSATALSVGRLHACAIHNGGMISCWGENGEGEVGDGNIDPTNGIDSPTAVVGLPSNAIAIAVSAGASHTCAVLKNGSAWCWGANDNGQLGNGTESGGPTPVQVSGW
jgi:alpha-tubulin suppressor-like RCC1 family protein